MTIQLCPLCPTRESQINKAWHDPILSVQAQEGGKTRKRGGKKKKGGEEAATAETVESSEPAAPKDIAKIMVTPLDHARFFCDLDQSLVIIV